jgi:hypothetical protein
MILLHTPTLSSLTPSSNPFFQRFKTLIFLEQFGLVCQFHEGNLTLNSFMNDIIFTLK